MISRPFAIGNLLAIGAALTAAQPAWALPGTVNLAPFGTATATGADFGASIEDGIDGNRNGDFNAGSVYYGNANPENPPLFYEVDLGVNAYIDRVQILRRTDADQGVFGNMRLTIYQDDGNGNPGAVAFTKDYLTGGFGEGGFEQGSWGTTDPSLNSPQGTLGRHVRLERIDNNYWLTFAEFEVIGRTTPLAFSEANNIARGKPVTTSSAPGYFSKLESANDGNIDGNFGGSGYQPVYHSSNLGIGEYWQVDLGSEKQLDYLELFARSDYYSTSEFKVSVLNQSLVEVGSFIVVNNPLTNPNPGYDHLVNTAGMTGQYIRVSTTKEEHLVFSELRAFEGPGSIPLEADFNGDGAVNGLDLAKWKQSFGGAGADANHDGVSDGADYLVWQRQFGSGGSAQVAAASVPEPSATLIAGGAALGLIGAAKRRRSACL
ncbi:discoidin domain-containing protein [Lacipirellula parvula]|uniref:F5/8 type C domain-containing protein n=1 Tax=Lacipirellula parvula TaxID=2650471 RepID=A0A5K7XA87_9BACT|nr:discoidin domain-containing protein [Lacipirellula parvula]BBO33335.1 hypothetical protein PLANPX_2947 [Lacipirellula parvula]